MRRSADHDGVRLGGQPASDDEVKAVFERLRVPASSRGALMKLWRQIEGAPQQ
jgi:hypothetical protein